MHENNFQTTYTTNKNINIKWGRPHAQVKEKNETKEFKYYFIMASTKIERYRVPKATKYIQYTLHQV